MKLPKYSLLLKEEGIITNCYNCGRVIKLAYTIKDNESGKVFNLGSECFKNYIGKTPTEIKHENDEYENWAKGQNQVNIKKKEFIELNKDIIDFIGANYTNNSFLTSVKRVFEEKGSLSYNMWAAVFLMMHEKFVTIINSKVNLSVKIYYSNMSAKYNYYKPSSLNGEPAIDSILKLNGLTLDNKSISFSITFPNSNISQLVDCGLLTGDLEIKDIKEGDYYLMDVSGIWDGYKIKRVKISNCKSIKKENNKII